jgi:hypothetical protein
MRVSSTALGTTPSLFGGTFTLSSVSGGSPCASTQAASRAAKAAAGPKSYGPRPTSDIAIEGTPRSVPSIAALTVPEYVTTSPRFAPRLIPDTSSVGFSGRIAFTARFTQSVGVPSTA